MPKPTFFFALLHPNPPPRGGKKGKGRGEEGVYEVLIAPLPLPEKGKRRRRKKKGEGSQRRKHTVVTTPNRHSAEFFRGCHNSEMRAVTTPKGSCHIGKGLSACHSDFPTYTYCITRNVLKIHISPVFVKMLSK